MGTLPVGLMTGAVAGPSKLIPGYLLNAKLVPGFRLVYGPFFGLPGDFMRVFVGLGEVCAGVGLIGGLWGTALGLFDGDFLDLVSALLICAPIGLITIMAFGSVSHVAMGEGPGLPCVLAVLSVIILACRVTVTPIDTLTADHQLLIQAFCGLCGVGAVLAVVIRYACGKPIEELKSIKANMEADEKAMEAYKKVPA